MKEGADDQKEVLHGDEAVLTVVSLQGLPEVIFRLRGVSGGITAARTSFGWSIQQ